MTYTLKEAAMLLSLKRETVAKLANKYGIGTRREGRVFLSEEELDVLRKRPTQRDRRTRSYKPKWEKPNGTGD